ncbi:organic solute transporter Ostalpha-domain-containing protein [Lophiotrema nucula]|uniref:Organic solute transporter Ostalpha-domain-containing protein n=1 Tax=Lophiotrema nucula TaxID=690887 RepID=A0A6A5ZCT3_9PLEO|nr:organic solute transporter Ostalpha-domain-containing protein [Lophiotrema nucula]
MSHHHNLMDFQTYNPVYPRALFSSDKNFTCAYPLPGEHGAKLPIGITFKWLMKLITFTSFCISVVSAFLVAWRHLTRYTVPREQKQIIRIVFLPVFQNLIALLSITFYVDSIYIMPIHEVYEAFTIAALFALFLEYVCPNPKERPRYFDELQLYDRKKKPVPGGSLLWFNRTYALVFQYPLTKTLSAIAEIATQAGRVYCTNSLSPKYAHIYIDLINYLVIGGAISAVFHFYFRLKKEIPAHHHAAAKLWTFKGMVLFQFFQDILFGLFNGKIFKADPTHTYDDLYYGLPAMLIALESMLFGLAFHWSYSAREYHEEKREGAKRMSIWRAALDALNLSDMIWSIYIAFKLLILKSSDKGKGLGKFDWARHNYGGPKRQRTKGFDSVAFEPLNHQRNDSSERSWHAPPTEPYTSAEPQYAPPMGPRPPHSYSGSQYHGGYSELDHGSSNYDEHRDSLLRADPHMQRDPSPSRPAERPRDFV